MIFRNDKISNNVYTVYSIKSTHNSIQSGFLICMYVCVYGARTHAHTHTHTHIYTSVVEIVHAILACNFLFSLCYRYQLDKIMYDDTLMQLNY